jgi:acyl-CoA reductase-like NAD-dependent aldehyde dehydrogenase
VLTASDFADVTPFVDGQPVLSSSSERLPVFDPASGRRLCDLPIGSVQDVDRAVASCRHSFKRGVWSGMPLSERKVVLHRWSDLIRANDRRLDGLDALEMGKPVSLGAFNALAASKLARFNAEAIDKLSGSVLPSDRGSTVLHKRVPRGVVAAVIPWNFPTYNALMKVAPALAAGNSVVLKPSELASQSALLLARLALDAGVPPGVLNVVPGRGESVGRALGEHMDVNMLTFTGSSAVGKLMLQYAGRSNMKTLSAECGGKSPHVVFDDGVNLDAVAQFVAGMIQVNQGQVCSVGSRLLVQNTIERELVSRIVAKLQGIQAGDPQLDSTTYGPLVSRTQMDKVLGYVQSANREGARLIHGGHRMLESSGGFFVQPTVFVDVPTDSRIAQEEVFGPVLSVMTFEDIDQAIDLANRTHYGLAAYVWSARNTTCLRVANSIHTAYTIVGSAEWLGEGPGHAFSGEPFGLSGTGVEGGLAGLETFLRRQTIWISHG